MDKLIVTISVISIEKEYELFIPINKKLGTIKKLIINAINETNNFTLPLSLNLYDLASGEMFSPHKFIFETNIRNGSKLILL